MVSETTDVSETTGVSEGIVAIISEREKCFE